MGIEYEADVASLHRDFLRRLREAMAAHARWQVLEQRDLQPGRGLPADAILLRFVGEPLRADWPEDALVSASGGRIYVLFHGGPAWLDPEVFAFVTQFARQRASRADSRNSDRRAAPRQRQPCFGSARVTRAFLFWST